ALMGKGGCRVTGTTEVPTLHFSTSDYPERDRLALWRELLGRKVLRLDMEPLPDVPPRFELTLLKTPGLALLAAEAGPARFERTPALISDGFDDYVLAVPCCGGTGIVRGRGREVSVGPGHALLRSLGEVSTFINPAL